MENVQIKITAKQYTKSQVSLLTKSMLIAAIAFVVLGAASYGFSVLFTRTLNPEGEMGLGLGLCLSMLLFGMVISMLWTMNMLKNGSVALTVVCYALYIGFMSVAFGWLFALASHTVNAVWLWVMFLVVGGVFALCALISYVVSLRTIITFGKIIAITSIVMSIFMIVFLILMIVGLATQSGGVILAGDAFCDMIMVIMSIVSFLYVIIDIWQISKLGEFAQSYDQPYSKILPWFCGYRLLTDLVNILFIAIFWLIKLGRRV